MVDRLKERGWVRRESPRGNRRTINVIITLDGRRAYVRNNRTFTVAVEQAVSARLSDDEQATLTSLLGRLGTGPPARQASGRSPTGRSKYVSIEFLITTLIIVATPGTAVIYTLAACLSRGAMPASSPRWDARSAWFRTWLPP